MQNPPPHLVRLLIIRLLTMAGLIVACILGFYFALKHNFEKGELHVLAILGGIVLGVALCLFRNGLELLARRRLLGKAMGRIGLAKDGLVALSGTVEPVTESLKFPFLDGEFIAVAYDVAETLTPKHQGKNQNTTGPPPTCKHMGGIVTCDARLRIETGTLPLCGILMPENFPLTKTPSAQHAEALLTHATHPDILPHQGLGVSNALSLMDTIGTVLHGSFSHEWAKPSLGDVVCGPDTRLEIKAIPSGSEVSVIGLYDSNANAILPDPGRGMLEIFPGNAREARKTMFASAARTLAMSLFLTVFSFLITFGVATLMQI